MRRRLQVCDMSALPQKADIAAPQTNVRFVPTADILRCSRSWRYSIKRAPVYSTSFAQA